MVNIKNRVGKLESLLFKDNCEESLLSEYMAMTEQEREKLED